ncbi:NAD(P)/FAD-dependent oxidoreductase [Corynebacterium silvaticum]|uniref:NADH:ubiquinone reductase (non-electrogenic) n=1 Tax=Corynebacterium silvaticum TaxID=2320431 RepID=A0A7Y4LIR7_9CORY|nr:NAD(P)/FAD-dependent oxidoreductase [Corynebacterium silvaticum]ARU46127.1 NAD(P)/FAD-dependent oxidoreductase [Corynebacterium silvaticum]MBH5299236.1 NAD(P)/FAD-dependent oxidoreductase [Corynebacterium silvaticum]NOM64445.1 NAD(P)/FAD-dependent oxidoreductase [Corynebacterium silvaticum]NON69653.1 NAD(P)/FAD-dependent oxidoreductase [Corynebacterium silvaticum]TFA94270.1 NAD(P)/FAD-dependent oxidoreductase [Corynebacterium silvaticum]
MSDNPFRPEGGRHHVVVIGSGFGGLFAVQNLKDADVDITLIDRTNHHLFQPLLYQVATGILSSGEIAPQTRQVLLKQDNVNVVKAEVTDINTSAKTVSASLGEYSKTIEYDSLIVAAGAGQSYFGNDHFAQYAPGMKTIDDALELRARILGAFERAEICDDPAERDRLLTFVIVGAGPTGVELAGQLAEMAHRTLAGEYTRFNPANAKIILLDGAPQVLPPFGKRLGCNAQRELEKIGVTVKLNAIVTDVDENSVTYKSTTDNSTHTINSFCKIWSAGVAASPLGKVLADQLGVDVDRAGRVPVNPDLSVGSEKNVFVIGDMMSLNNLPGVAQTAIQGGAYVAEQIAAEVEGRSADEREPFEYYDKGSMATVSRFNAVVKLGKVEVTGFIGWVMWLCVHLMFLVGFRNRATAAFSWGINALSRKRWNLATTRQQLHARGALAEQDKNLEAKN